MLEIGMFLVDRYEILGKIGAGGMADVYKVKDHILGRVVAVKVLKPEYSEDVNFVTKFRTEAQSAAGLEHPNIVNIYDVGSENGLHFIVMEHVEGITLKTYIEKKGQLSFKEAASIAIQVARGIEAAHNKEIIHRDIKPQNIIISTEGKVKVTDFGIARASNSNTISADVMGSVHYASPEQARNGFVDGRSDLYSLGIVMYEMVTGRVPFDGDTTVAVALQHLQEEMVGPSVYAPELPISYEKIVLKCTQKNPDRRYQTIEELLADLRKALVTPDEDFVVIAPGPVAAKTRIIGSEELELINDGAKGANLEAETHFATGVDEEDIEDIEDAEDDEVDDYEETESGFMDPKVEKILTYVGIALAVVIVILTVYFGISLWQKLFPKDTGKQPSSQPTQSESIKDSETDSNDKNLVEMIDITGMSVEEAEEALEKLGLEIFVGAQEISSKKDGTILEQNIEEGEKVSKGTTVTVVIAGQNPNQQLIAVPDVVDLSEADAIKMLEKQNFLYEKKYEPSDTVEKGYVISQTPEYGDKAKAGSRVTIVISEGPAAVKLPALSKLKGEKIDDVIKTLEDLEFEVNVIEEWNSDYAEGIVYKVPDAGKEKTKGSTIDVYVSKGKKPLITYEVSFNPADNRPSDAVAFSYKLYINGSEEPVKSRTEITDFDTVITYSGSDITSAKIEIEWFKESDDATSYESLGTDKIKLTPVEVDNSTGDSESEETDSQEPSEDEESQTPDEGDATGNNEDAQAEE